MTNKQTKQLINELLDYIYSKDNLRAEIDEYLDIDGYTINAIKLLRLEVLTYHRSKKYTLRDIRDAIDTYSDRFHLSKKLGRLVRRIEEWATTNKWAHPKYYDKIEFQPNQNLHNDWKLVDEHNTLMVTDSDWLPAQDEFKQYNALWRKYKCP